MYVIDPGLIHGTACGTLGTDRSDPELEVLSTSRYGPKPKQVKLPQVNDGYVNKPLRKTGDSTEVEGHSP